MRPATPPRPSLRASGEPTPRASGEPTPRASGEPTPRAFGATTPRASGATTPRASGATVILIEDDPVLARSIGQRLRLEGVTAYWARSVAEGEAMPRRHRPTLLVCDMRLPDGSGEEMLARLVPELGGVPVVAVTAYGGVEQAVRPMRIGVDDYLVAREQRENPLGFSAFALAQVSAFARSSRRTGGNLANPRRR